jgi:type I restriction enzyme M protein
LNHLAVRIVIDLPNETFAPFGANVRSGVLFGRKLRPGEKVEPKAKVCMIRIDSLGYDASGRDTGGSETEMAVKVATDFLRKEGW